jgi:homoserine dehydrogenase
MKIAIAGFGNIGRAFAELVLERHKDIEIVALTDRSGVLVSLSKLEINTLLQSKSTGRSLSQSGAKFVLPEEAVAMFAQVGVEVVVEALPSNLSSAGEPAITVATDALRRGMQFITANKAVLLFAGSTLESIAAERGVKFAHSGATCAALPTLSFARRELAGANITRIRGVLNGTTNYILTRMSEQNVTFAEALLEAQQKGIAEPDPSYDLEGMDSAVKITILANFLMNANSRLDRVLCRGISEPPTALIEEAQQTRGAIRLMAVAERRESNVLLSVKPQVIASSDPFFAVRGSNKAVEFETDLYGTLMVAGGASSRKAVAAVMLRDLLAK